MWFLVTIGGGQYIGPLPAPECAYAAAILRERGVVCRMASKMTACPVPGTVNSYTACPVFDFPHVTVKP